MNHTNRSNRARISASALSFAVTLIGVIALTTASQHPVRRPAVSVDSHPALRADTATGGGMPSLPAGVLSDDPELMRIDRGSAHHG